VLLHQIRSHLQLTAQSSRIVEILLTQTHDIQSGVDICQFDARSVVEQEVLGVDRVVDAFQSGTRNAKDFESETSRTTLLVALEEIWFICISCCNVIAFAGLCEDALTKMLWQIRMYLELALDDSLRLHMGRSECFSVEIKIAFLHALHNLLDSLCLFLLIWFDGLDSRRVKCQVGSAGRRA
jgi:hypothetical protein